MKFKKQIPKKRHFAIQNVNKTSNKTRQASFETLNKCFIHARPTVNCKWQYSGGTVCLDSNLPIFSQIFSF